MGGFQQFLPLSLVLLPQFLFIFFLGNSVFGVNLDFLINKIDFFLLNLFEFFIDLFINLVQNIVLVLIFIFHLKGFSHHFFILQLTKFLLNIHQLFILLFAQFLWFKQKSSLLNLTCASIEQQIEHFIVLFCCNWVCCLDFMFCNNCLQLFNIGLGLSKSLDGFWFSLLLIFQFCNFLFDGWGQFELFEQGDSFLLRYIFRQDVIVLVHNFVDVFPESGQIGTLFHK